MGCNHEQQHQELLLMDLKNLFFQIPFNHYFNKKASSRISSNFISPKYYDFEKGQYFLELRMMTNLFMIMKKMATMLI